MNQVITATFEDGVLKPHQDLGLRPGSKVRLLLSPWEEASTGELNPCDEFDRLCDEIPIHSSAPRLTRDQLHNPF